MAMASILDCSDEYFLPVYLRRRSSPDLGGARGLSLRGGVYGLVEEGEVGASPSVPLVRGRLGEVSSSASSAERARLLPVVVVLL
ncbi:hypothetical protein KVT40_003273 [Elsinoe batatas]|uniref:Uncharacterized protein n=1 Tax=Elsinoe batatas TaxID=2601811 RepID=A0A8K0LBX6_9PEZI|nr:hypothetical protein KVT40_003273 [Elsinoe batatas]